ncbi:MAG: S8 family peptidase [Candidatus Riflebacteria bacterium]|nr:S8 family peptidase [Candidatus Riflebacteria bacterium]
MSRENNFLLGNGEKLAKNISIKSSGGDKNPPYNLQEAKNRIYQRLLEVQNTLSALPDELCPNNEAIALVTMHPRYISKSDFPQDLFTNVGLRSVGSRIKKVKPEQWGIKKPPEEALTEEIFVAGTRKAFQKWSEDISKWNDTTKGAKDLSHIESIGLFEPETKLKGIPTGKEKILLEVVLHNGANEQIIFAFVNFAKRLQAEPLIERRRDVGGLTFIPVRVKSSLVQELACFTFVRVARGMPTLRPLRPNVLRMITGFDVVLPKEGPVDPSFRAVIFDGGITKTAQEALRNWVTLIEPQGVGISTADFEAHGLAVTTAFLFGPLSDKKISLKPVCHVDHVRVLDARNTTDKDFEYNDILDHITNYLKTNPGKYQYCNISLGPDLAINDDEITAWTAALDQEFVNGTSVVTVAAGNSGERDDEQQLNRIQPPADGVNLLAVGSADNLNGDWKRAVYSSLGPGRSPGLIKPDGVAFGGSDENLFGILQANLKGNGNQGTSFAAPFTLRTAAAVRAQLGDYLRPLAIRALLIHRAEPNGQCQREIGWGRFESDPLKLITCDDNEVLVVYQGDLPVGEHLRANVPLPIDGLVGPICITATLVIAPEVDPEFPSTYTRSGLEVSFRPHVEKFTTYGDGKIAKHAKTVPFFSAKNMYGKSEYKFREDGGVRGVMERKTPLRNLAAL